MQMITPLCYDTCKNYIGQQVCAVTNDGRRYMGTLYDVSEKGIHFAPSNEANVKSSKKGGKQSEKGAQTSAFYPYGYGANFVAWTALAALFLVPFLFI